MRAGMWARWWRGRMMRPGHGGVYVMCGDRPGGEGNTGFCVYAVDRLSGRRWVLDAYYLTAPTPKQIRERIEEITVKFKPHEFIVGGERVPVSFWCGMS